MANLLLIAALFILACLYLWRSTSRHRRGSTLALPPGPTGLPVFGSLLSLSTDNPTDTFNEYRAQYGDIFGVQLGQKYCVVLNSFSLVKDAFVKQGNMFSGRPSPLTMNTVFGVRDRGIGNSEGEYNKQHRRFSLHILKDFGMGRNVMEQNISVEASRLVEAFMQQRSQPFDPHNYLMCAVSNIICQITFNKRSEYDDPEFLHLLDHMEAAFRALGAAGPMNFMEWTRYLPGIKEQYQAISDASKTIRSKFFEPQIAYHRRTFDSSHIRDVIDAYLLEIKTKNYDTFTEEDLTLLLFDFFFAGTDTTTTVLRWIFLYLLHYPRYQEKIHAEIDEHVGQNRCPTMNDRKFLTYTDTFIKEALRCCDISPLALPHSNIEEVEFAGYRIPARTWIFANFDRILNDPKCFHDPEVFKPERFFDGTTDTTEALIPFSLGGRNCIGEGLAKMELFIFFATIMQKFNVERSDPALQAPSLQGHFGIVHSPYPYKVRMVPR